MKNILKFYVKNDDGDIRIDRWLRRKFSDLPQSFFEKKLRKGLIRLNNKIIKSNKKIFYNDIIEIFDYDKQIYSKTEIKKHNYEIPSNLLKKFNSSIFFENKDYIVINKWNGIATQGGTKIINSIDSIIKNINNNMNLVHRLDIGTTGSLIISKNYLTSRFFGQQFKEKKIKKVYLALCIGKPIKNKGTINLKLTKKINKNKKIKQKNNIESVTNYELIECKQNISSIIFLPITGKTHQIRIVAQYLGCSILGDRKYNKFRNNHRKHKNTQLMLHALAVNFSYKNKNTFHFAKLNDEMTNNFKKFGLKIPKEKTIEKYLFKN